MTDARPWYIYRGVRLPGVPRHPRTQTLCQIVCEGRGPGPHNVAIRFADGYTLVTARATRRDGKPGSLRPARRGELQTDLF